MVSIANATRYKAYISMALSWLLCGIVVALISVIDAKMNVDSIAMEGVWLVDGQR